MQIVLKSIRLLTITPRVVCQSFCNTLLIQMAVVVCTVVTSCTSIRAVSKDGSLISPIQNSASQIIINMIEVVLIFIAAKLDKNPNPLVYESAV